MIHKKAKILIVEDEVIVALDIKNVIKKLGFEVIGIVKNYDEAIQCVSLNTIDLILMDINLKNSKDGIEIAREILKTHYIPIIYLTAFSDEQTIQRAVKTNPVGYVVKPFKREDLKVSIELGLYKANFKESKSESIHDNLILGEGYHFNFDKDILYFHDIIIRLSIKENKLLRLLISARGNLVSFEQIEYEIWSENNVSKSTFRTLLYRLRAKLNNKLIETVYASGCKLNFTQ